MTTITIVAESMEKTHEVGINFTQLTPKLARQFHRELATGVFPVTIKHQEKAYRITRLNRRGRVYCRLLKG